MEYTHGVIARLQNVNEYHHNIKHTAEYCD